MCPSSISKIDAVDGDDEIHDDDDDCLTLEMNMWMS